MHGLQMLSQRRGRSYRAAGLLSLEEKRQLKEALSPAKKRRSVFSTLTTEHVELYGVVTCEHDVGKGKREVARRGLLPVARGVGHGSAIVEKEIGVQLLFFLEQFDVGAISTT